MHFHLFALRFCSFSPISTCSPPFSIAFPHFWSYQHVLELYGTPSTHRTHSCLHLRALLPICAQFSLICTNFRPSPPFSLDFSHFWPYRHVLELYRTHSSHRTHPCFRFQTFLIFPTHFSLIFHQSTPFSLYFFHFWPYQHILWLYITSPIPLTSPRSKLRSVAPIFDKFSLIFAYFHLFSPIFTHFHPFLTTSNRF